MVTAIATSRAAFVLAVSEAKAGIVSLQSKDHIPAIERRGEGVVH